MTKRRIIALLLLISLLLPLIACGDPIVRVGADAAEYVGLQHEEVFQAFQDAGFTNIKGTEFDDLTSDSELDDGAVGKVLIDGADDFSKKDSFPPDVSVEIEYHIIPKLQAPMSSSDRQNYGYMDIAEMFEEAGFDNIKTDVIQDLDPDETDDLFVNNVSVNGSTSFDKNEDVRFDATIRITQHIPYEKYTANINVNFIGNWIFSKYDVDAYFDNELLGKLDHGTDANYSIRVPVGSKTVLFQKDGSNSVSGSIDLDVSSDVDVTYKISCYNDHISVDEESLEYHTDAITLAAGPVEHISASRSVPENTDEASEADDVGDSDELLEVTPEATPEPSPTEVPTPSLSPSPAPSPSPSPSPSPTPEPSPSPTQTPTPQPSPTPAPAILSEPKSGEITGDSSFHVLFLDVGQADCALISCDGHSMLIDGGNAADSSLVYSTLQYWGIDHLDYIVCTHPDEDHVGGLAGALNYATVDTAFCSVTEDDGEAFGNFLKYLNAQGKEITVPKAGLIFSLGTASAQIVGPIKQSSDDNDNSLVIRIVYGDTSFLFTGDAGRDEELDILEASFVLNSTVLKVGHHGSAYSTTYPFLREVMPEVAVISVGQGNSYGHPTDETLSILRDAGAKVYRTDMQGYIYCYSDGKEVTVTPQKNPDIDTLAPGPYVVPTPAPTPTPTPTPAPSSSGQDYVLNTNTMKFHYPWCRHVSSIKDKNRQDYYGTRDEILAMGYDPCAICNP